MTFRERLIQEEKELVEKIGKLQKFIWTNKNEKAMVSEYQLELLEEQIYHMVEYANILRQRNHDLKESE